MKVKHKTLIIFMCIMVCCAEKPKYDLKGTWSFQSTIGYHELYFTNDTLVGILANNPIDTFSYKINNQGVLELSGSKNNTKYKYEIEANGLELKMKPLQPNEQEFLLERIDNKWKPFYQTNLDSLIEMYYSRYYE